jgi:hypothetical protein
MLLIFVTISSFIIFIILSLIIANKITTLNHQFNDQTRHRQHKRLRQLNKRYLAGNFNQVFQNHSDSGHIIDQFIISEEEGRSFLLCHFSHGSITSGILEICMYNKKEQLTHRAYISDIESFKHSAHMALPLKTTYVNIHYHQDKIKQDHYDDFYVNRNLRYNTIAKLESMAVLALILPLTNLVFNRLFTNGFNTISLMEYFYISLIIAVCLSILNYMFVMAWLTKRFEGEDK